MAPRATRGSTVFRYCAQKLESTSMSRHPGNFSHPASTARVMEKTHLTPSAKERVVRGRFKAGLQCKKWRTHPSKAYMLIHLISLTIQFLFNSRDGSCLKGRSGQFISSIYYFITEGVLSSHRPIAKLHQFVSVSPGSAVGEQYSN